MVEFYHKYRHSSPSSHEEVTMYRYKSYRADSMFIALIQQTVFHYSHSPMCPISQFQLPVDHSRENIYFS